ncbi:hypothetical protein G5V59_02665 [Nocardioides sp. W3-2-3]|uniref:hypothetical protein n=1 Tax=Nocardioides convexus TaxID=2712224 RepID=UPI0024188902|nr:hypothetical protein [Nocardioides convexus]NGZ99655.1 hypothetical protein [Nocardioides convexus]
MTEEHLRELARSFHYERRLESGEAPTLPPRRREHRAQPRRRPPRRRPARAPSLHLRRPRRRRQPRLRRLREARGRRRARRPDRAEGPLRRG